MCKARGVESFQIRSDCTLVVRVSETQFGCDFHGPAVAGLQQRTVCLSSAVVRADRVNNPPGRQVACCRPVGVTCSQSVREPLDAVTQDGGASRAMNRAIRAATPAYSRVRGINHGVDLLRGDVATNRGDSQHAAQYASGHRRQPGGRLRRRLTGPEPVRDHPGIPSGSSITPGRG